MIIMLSSEALKFYAKKFKKKSGYPKVLIYKTYII